jgi:cold shock CspA family protein
MPFSGTLRSWNDARGFGFIAPTDGGREILVHASAFPADGSHPTVGETLIFEVGRGKGGKRQAIQVRRKTLSLPSVPAASRSAKPARSRAFQVLVIVALAALVVVAVWSAVT